MNARLAAAVRPDMFALYTAPAINLFEKTTDRIPIKSNQHEYHVVPDRSRYLDFEPHRVLDVYAHFPGGQDKVPVRPLYSASMDETAARSTGLFYTVRRLPRRRTVEEKALRRRRPTIPAPTCSSRLVEPGGIERRRARSPSSACARCARTGI